MNLGMILDQHKGVILALISFMSPRSGSFTFCCQLLNKSNHLTGFIYVSVITGQQFSHMGFAPDQPQVI